MSRGASLAVFVDSGREATRVIKENLETLGMEGRGVVVRCDIIAYLQAASRAQPPFQLIFIDPPYKIEVAYREEMLKRLSEGGFLGPSAVVVMEAPLRSSIPSPPPELEFRERRRYGETAVDVYVCKEKNVRERKGGEGG